MMLRTNGACCMTQPSASLEATCFLGPVVTLLLLHANRLRLCDKATLECLELLRPKSKLVLTRREAALSRKGGRVPRNSAGTIVRRKGDVP